MKVAPLKQEKSHCHTAGGLVAVSTKTALVHLAKAPIVQSDTHMSVPEAAVEFVREIEKVDRGASIRRDFFAGSLAPAVVGASHSPTC